VVPDCFACCSLFIRFVQHRPGMVSFSKSRGGLDHSPTFHSVRVSIIHFTFLFPLHSNTERRCIVGSETRRRRPKVYEREGQDTPDTKLPTPPPPHTIYEHSTTILTRPEKSNATSQDLSRLLLLLQNPLRQRLQRPHLHLRLPRAHPRA
jgi:hypothetical protein